MPNDTVFHKIFDRKLPATVAFEDAETLAILDIFPKAPTHVLFIPKTFVESIDAVAPDTARIPGMLIEKARVFAKRQGIDGYKLLFNVGKKGGQEIPYIHLHFMSDQPLKDGTLEKRPAIS